MSKILFSDALDYAKFMQEKTKAGKAPKFAYKDALVMARRFADVYQHQLEIIKLCDD